MAKEKLCINQSRLEGLVSISGAKNSALRLLAASLLTGDQVVLDNYPSSLLDAQIHVAMLEKLGKRCHLLGNKSILIEEINGLTSSLEWEGRSIRNTLLILGALTARTGKGAVPLPGGCQLGDRSFDIHELVLRSLGASLWQEGNMLYAEAPKGGLVGADIYLPLRSTGATENAVISGTVARGITRIWNPHIRPEILDLISFLNNLGAKIKVFGQEHIEVTGVEGLNGGQHSVILDNMEAITWLVGAVMTKGDVEIRGFPHRDLEVVLAHLKSAGARLYHSDDSVIVRGGTCYPVEISTGPHPGINSDVQPILAAWASAARGMSKIVDLRFPGRYGYAKEMAKMGVDYAIKGDMLIIDGNKSGNLRGAVVTALDLRAGAALALCGLVSEGSSIINEAWQIERGYVDFVEKLTLLGGRAKWLD